MTLALTHSVALLGLEGHLVTVEVDIADGLPGYSLLGLPDAALTESRERVRSAIVNCGEVWPNRKVTVSLSPAWLPKSGSSFDLAICIALLSAHESIAKEKIEELLFIKDFQQDMIVEFENLTGQELSKKFLPEHLSNEIQRKKKKLSK